MSILNRFFNLEHPLFWESPKQQPKEIDPAIVQFTERLVTRDFKYNKDKSWWERTWTTNHGQESALEVYQLVDGSKWKAIMISSDGDIFYEHFMEDLT